MSQQLLIGTMGFGAWISYMIWLFLWFCLFFSLCVGDVQLWLKSWLVQIVVWAEACQSCHCVILISSSQNVNKHHVLEYPVYDKALFVYILARASENQAMMWHACFRPQFGRDETSIKVAPGRLLPGCTFPTQEKTTTHKTTRCNKNSQLSQVSDPVSMGK